MSEAGDRIRTIVVSCDGFQPDFDEGTTAATVLKLAREHAGRIADEAIADMDALLLEAYHYGGFGGLYSAEYDDWMQELRDRIKTANIGGE